MHRIGLLSIILKVLEPPSLMPVRSHRLPVTRRHYRHIVMEINKVFNEDCLTGMKSLPDNCVDCCVTSPPYFNLRDYGIDGQIGLEKSPEEYIDRLTEVFTEVFRVLKPEGTLWLNLGDSYDNAKSLIGIPWMAAFALRDRIGFRLRNDIIWHKLNPQPESIKDRCTKAHEYIFLMSKQEKYFFDHEAIQEIATGYDGRKDTIMHGSKKYNMPIKYVLIRTGYLRLSAHQRVFHYVVFPAAPLQNPIPADSAAS
jgi:DNA modification methylase